MKKKIISVILVIIWMIIIFLFSAMDGDESNSKSKGTIDKTITEAANVTNKLNITDVNVKSDKKVPIVDVLNKYLRKCMHASVYLVLSVLIYITLINFNIKGKKAFLLAIILSFLYACTDEYHQTFVSGRTGQFKDVLIDTIGAFIGAIIYSLILKIYSIKHRIGGKDVS